MFDPSAVDPHNVRESTVQLNLEALDLDHGLLDAEGKFGVEDLISGESWRWGADNYVQLDPHVESAHVLHIRR